MAVIDHTKPQGLPKFDNRILDLRGKRFGRLVVELFAGRTRKSQVVWKCRCDCGNYTLATSNSLRHKVERSKKRSCGCLAIDVTVSRSVTHGMTKTPEYGSWKSMKYRCYCTGSAGYHRYGGRGIEVCDRWINSFENFLADMGNVPAPDYTLDRIDGDGNYTPENCRWANYQTQAQNRKQPEPWLEITFQGKTQTIDKWAEELDIKVGTIYCRRSKGWPVEKVLSRNLRARRLE